MNEQQKPRGAGLLPIHQGLAVFGVKRIVTGTSGISLHLTGIGGKVEPDETYLQCAVRECVEETSVTPRIVNSRRTWIMTRAEVRETAPSADTALFIVEKETPGFTQPLEIRIYAAYLDEAPLPVEKLRHLFFIPLDLLREVGEHGVTIASLLDRGAHVVSGEGEHLPFDARASFIDSPEVYAKHLDEDMLEYIRTLVIAN